MKREERISFLLRVIHNKIKDVIHKSVPKFEKGPKSQLQGGILGYLYDHRAGPVYQRDLEKEFRISRATATNTLQVMERDGLIVRQAMDKDARLKRIRLTEEAYANHKEIEKHMSMLDRRLLEGMTEAEAEELGRLLRILLKNLETAAEELSGTAETPESTEKIPTADSAEEIKSKSDKKERECIKDAQNTWSTNQRV